MTHVFGAQEQLAAVRLYVQINRTDGDAGEFRLMTTFPRKVFTDGDMDTPLKNLGTIMSPNEYVSDRATASCMA